MAAELILLCWIVVLWLDKVESNLFSKIGMTTARKNMDLSICIVNWNRLDLLIPCLESIYKSIQHIHFEIIVVDNASDDEIDVVIVRDFPQVIFIANEENLGFGRANNQALKASKGKYCLLLNNDTVILDDALNNMVAIMESREDVGVLTCALYPGHDLSDVGISFGHTFPTPRILLLNDFVHLTGLTKLFPLNNWIQKSSWTGYDPKQEQDVEHVSGACMMVRREVMEETGILDETYFMYMEETDWCYRIRQRGWRICYTPEAKIVHYGEQGSKLRNDRDALYFKSICHFFQKHYGLKSVIGYKIGYYLLVKPLKMLRKIVYATGQCRMGVSLLKRLH
ncbi:uncharacterized protein METZ01_LOCUS105643 [marine metagenome]|uniref:Glycosyltransferase 2-like domain-containing protein n=1 Tax=marine metagenome TaxID=408172 RepID=A0A381WJZ7_9ZZZZ